MNKQHLDGRPREKYSIPPNRNVYQSNGHLFIARSRTSGSDQWFGAVSRTRRRLRGRGQLLARGGPRHWSAGGWESLTATERAASLVADGLTNGAVARRLSISPHIVNTHLRHVFAKLGVPDRAALAAVVHHSIK
jgi:DNA-binding CsgD family transcriptional regulator